MVLVFRYLYKEKGIFYRDLIFNNIMLGEDDKVIISKLLFLSLGVGEGDDKVIVSKFFIDS